MKQRIARGARAPRFLGGVAVGYAPAPLVIRAVAGQVLFMIPVSGWG